MIAAFGREKERKGYQRGRRVEFNPHTTSKRVGHLRVRFEKLGLKPAPEVCQGLEFLLLYKAGGKGTKVRYPLRVNIFFLFELTLYDACYWCMSR